MTYLNRNNFPKFWPIPRKGTKYVAVASHDKKNAIPLIVVMRDILNLVKTKKELKKIVSEKQVKINLKLVKEINYPVCLFDVISLLKINKNYRAVLSENKKIIFEEVSDKETELKTFKIIGKKILRNKKLQLNLMHGRNIISNEKVRTGDSVILNLRENKVVKIIPMEKGRNVYVIEGKHAGSKGKIEEIMERGGKKIAKIISDKKEKVNVWIKNIIVVE